MARPPGFNHRQVQVGSGRPVHGNKNTAAVSHTSSDLFAIIRHRSSSADTARGILCPLLLASVPCSGCGVCCGICCVVYLAWLFAPLPTGFVLPSLHYWTSMYATSLSPFKRREADRMYIIAVEAAGYTARIFSHYDTVALGPYIVPTMRILVAPSLFAASIYLTLG